MKYINQVKTYGTRVATGAVALGASGLALAQSSSSYLPSNVSSGYAQITSDFSTLTGLAWPIIATVAFTFVAVRLFKKAASKT